MKTAYKHRFITAALIGSLALAGCDLDVGDLNNPGIGDLEDNPTRVTVGAASTGLLIGNRGNFSAANGYVTQLGILGREAFNFDAADPRYVGELLTTSLNSGSPFGGNFWTGPYANIRLSNIILHAVDKVPDYSAEEKSAILGFAKTIQALDLLEVVVTHDTNGIVIDTDRELADGFAPLVDPAEAYETIVALLDAGAADLDGGGDAFPFALSKGYAGFDTPAAFRSFNRAILARVKVYTGDYAGALLALDESFLADPVAGLTADDLALGVFHSYSTGSGDTTNGLINPNIFAHPKLATDLQTGDARGSKFEVTESPGASPTTGLSSNLKFTLYTAPNSPTPIIRNEELLLLQAEALWFTGMEAQAIAQLNKVRAASGGLTAVAAPADDAAFTTLLLYERRYSLLFEGGHRWIDLRRFGMLGDQALLDPLTPPAVEVMNVRYPLPLAECQARGGAEGEPRCGLSSQ